MDLEYFNNQFKAVKTSELFGRYINNSHIETCLKNFSDAIISVEGYSVEERPIYSLKFGNGTKKILLWSQMHGNESTTTKALFDCFNFFKTDNAYSKSILESCTLLVIPILNPDGAERYTRINANEVDLNRDAQDLSQPESKVLRRVYENFKPDYCFNLHGQRTIFGAGKSGVSATLSFLSPAQDNERSLTKNRKQAMAIISEINSALQAEIPNGIGRYDDGFNINCVGDTFQSFGVPTLLYEAGHYKNDYDREEVRRLSFLAILKGLLTISDGYEEKNYENYFNIPSNKKCFYDIIIRNVKVENNNELVDIAIQYKEQLIGNNIEFTPKVERISKLDQFFGHKEIDAKGAIVKKSENSDLKINDEIDFVTINKKKITLIL